MELSGETPARSPASDRVPIMAKAPRPGAVKTRLAGSLSPDAVCSFYCCLLGDTLALARSLRVWSWPSCAPNRTCLNWRSWPAMTRASLRRKVTVSPRASRRYLNNSQKIARDG